MGESSLYRNLTRSTFHKSLSGFTQAAKLNLPTKRRWAAFKQVLACLTGLDLQKVLSAKKIAIQGAFIILSKINECLMMLCFAK